MDDNENVLEKDDKESGFSGLRVKQNIIRFIAATAILIVTAYMAPNFETKSIPILLLVAFVILILDYMMSVVTGIHDHPIARGFVGFTSALILIYMTQFFVDGYYISVLSTLIAAAIYGVVDSLLPNK